MASTFARKPMRTIEDGPTTKQKVMVSFIWIGSAFFGITTCFPDKVFGVELSQKIREDQGCWGLTFQPQNGLKAASKQNVIRPIAFSFVPQLLVSSSEGYVRHVYQRDAMTCKSFEYSRTWQVQHK